MYLTHANNTYHIIDIEGDLIPSTVVWCAVVQTISFNLDGTINKTRTPARSFRPNDLGALKDFIETERTKPNTYFVGHNIIGYDGPTLNRILGTGLRIDGIVDTLTLSYLFDPYIAGGHSLRAWGERLGGKEKIEFDDFSKFSEEQLTYCQGDVELTERVFLRLTERMNEYGFSNLSCEIEHKIRRILDTQKEHGVKFDVRKAETLLAELSTEKAILEGKIHETFPPELVVFKTYNYRPKKDGSPSAHFIRHKAQYPKLQFNKAKTKYRVFDYKVFDLASPVQRKDRLLSIGWTPTEMTPKGNPKVTDDSIELFLAKVGSDAPDAVTLIPKWVTVNSRVASLREWLGQCHDDERIRGTIFTCGARTRRMRHNNPNTGNIVNIDKPYGAELRSCWTVSEGKVMVGVDAKGLEGRVLMHYLNNPSAEAFLTSDFHTANAEAVNTALGRWRSDFDDHTKHTLRQQAKTLFYAFLYGAGNGKLGRIIGGVGKKIRAALIANVPGLAELVSDIQTEQGGNALGLIKTIDGGFVRCRSSHAALNYICQSAGAILMKQARILLDEQMDHTKAFSVLDVHDEWQFECDPDYATELGELACACITEAGEKLGFRVKMEGDVNVGGNWAETH